MKKRTYQLETNTVYFSRPTKVYFGGRVIENARSVSVNDEPSKAKYTDTQMKKKTLPWLLFSELWWHWIQLHFIQNRHCFVDHIDNKLDLCGVHNCSTIFYYSQLTTCQLNPMFFTQNKIVMATWISTLWHARWHLAIALPVYLDQHMYG